MYRYLILGLFLFSSFVTANAWSQVSASPNPSTTGDFTISWPDTGATSYRLTESVNGGSSSEIYSGTSRVHPLSGRVNGAYEYLVEQDVNLGQGSGLIPLGNVTVTVLDPTPTPIPTPTPTPNPVGMDLGGGKYDVYLGAINPEDSASDVYFHGKEQFIPIHGEIMIPLILPAAPSYEVLTNFYSTIVQGPTGELYDYHTDLLAPAVVEPSYTDDEITTLGLVLLQENRDYFIGDFNGDGFPDILLFIEGEVTDYGPSYSGFQGSGRFIMFNGGGNTDPFSAVSQGNISGRLAGNLGIFDGHTFTVRDIDGDGRDELVFEGGAVLADVSFNFSTSGGVAAYSADFYQEPVSIEVANLNGASTGAFRVSESGAATYNVPITLPAGTAGVAPELSLSYSSQMGNGFMGWGWQLNGLSAISRCRKTLLVDGEAGPLSWGDATFCYSGQRLIKASESTGIVTYRTAVNSYTTIKAYGSEASPDYFTVTSRDGSLSTFGLTTDAKQLGYQGSIYTWAINRFEDGVGNPINFAYTQNNGSNFLLDKISYAYGSGTHAHAEVQFNYSGRIDILGGYVGGHLMNTSVRLDSIVVKNEEPSAVGGSAVPEEIRSYNLHYLRSADIELFNRSYVRAIQECVAGNCLPPTMFDWSRDVSLAFDEPVITDKVTYGENTLGQTVPMDVNGDGFMDILWSEHGEHDDNRFYKILYMIFDPSTQSFGDPEHFVGSTGKCDKAEVYERPDRILLCESWRNVSKRVTLQSIDYNGDGRHDLAMYRDDRDAWYIHLSNLNSDGSWQLSGTADVVFDPGSSESMFMDADSDGLQDLVTPEKIYYLRPKDNADPSSSSIYTYEVSEGAETESVNVIWDIERELNPADEMNDLFEWIHYEYGFASAGDFNADGVADVVLIDRRAEGGIELVGAVPRAFTSSLTEIYYIAIREGSTFRVTERIWSDDDVDDRGYSGQVHNRSPLVGFYISDVNGDGYSDIMHTKSSAENNSKYVFRLNTGTGLADPVELSVAEFDPIFSLKDKNLSLQDMNGDGYLDVILTISGSSSVKYRPWNNETLSFEENTLNIYGQSLSGQDARSLFYDTSGDGRLDVVFFSKDRFGIAINNSEGPQNVVTAITNGLGATTDIEYEPLHSSSHYLGLQYAATDEASSTVDVGEFYRSINDPFAYLDGQEVLNSSDAPVLEYLSAMLIVTAIEGNAPSGNKAIGSAEDVKLDTKSRLEYFYYQGRLQAGGLGFLGFKALATEEPISNIRTTSFYRQDWPFAGSPERTEQRLPSGNILSLSESQWGLIGWDPSWRDQIDVDGAGASVLDSIHPYLKQIDQTTYNYRTANLQTEIEPSWVVGTTPVFCKPGASCPTPGESANAVLQSVSTSNVHDVHGNLTEVTTTTEGDGLTLLSVVTSSFAREAGSTIALHGENLSYAELGRVTSTNAVTTRGANAPITRESKFTYFESGHLAGMLESEEIEPNNPEARVKTTYAYDSQGNKTRADTVARNHAYKFDGTIAPTENQTRSQTFVMDVDTYRYVDTTKTILNGAEFTKEIVSERNKYGSPTKIISAVSDLETTIQYDILGREIYRSDNADSVNNDGLGAWAAVEYLKCSGSMRCAVGTSYVVRKTAAGGGLSLTFYDVLGRVIREASQGFEGSLSYVDTEYNNKGQVLRISAPYFAGEPELQWTHNTLDILGRPVSIRTPNGAITSQSYSGYSTTFTNAIGISRTETKNGLGELVRVEEALGASIHYDYDGSGNLQYTRSLPAPGDPLQSDIVIEIGYDSQSRKIFMKDPDKGDWEYKYNAFGDLVWQRDAKGQVVVQRYDASGRLASRIDYKNDGGIEGETTWFFDGYTDASPTERVVDNALMQVSAVVMRRDAGTSCDANSAIQCAYPSYDRFGRGVASQVLNSVKEGAGNRLESFATEQSFDSIGRVATQSDALNGVVISPRENDARYMDNSIQSGTENHYNVYGFLESVSDLQTGIPIYTLVSTNARGQALVIDRGNGVTSRNTYDPQTGQLTKQVGDISDLFKVQYIDYSWDNIGNLTSRTNDSNRGVGAGRRGLVESFCYDGLNRLIKTNVEALGNVEQSIGLDCLNLAVGDRDMEYDSRGNILRKQDVGTYTYDTGIAGPHAVTSTSDNHHYFYDANGNMVYEDIASTRDRTFTYSTFDKPTQIVKGALNSPSHTTSFRYGIDRGRYWREDVDKNGVVTTTEYRGGVERITKSDEPEKIKWKRYLGKSAIITLTTDTNNNLLAGDDDYTARYVYSDHLGSIDVITDEAGGVVQSMSFNAWGGRRNADTWADFDTANLVHDLSVLELFKLKENTTRGYTGHEMLDEVGIIHMNGRIYDPRLARFLQADPIIQAVTATQSLNRYSYVWNNPLNSTDPSGFINYSAWRRGIQAVVQIVVTVVATYVCGPCSIAVAAMFAKMNGGSDSDVFRAALGAFISYGMGAVSAAADGLNAYYQAAVVGTIGGVMSVINGGKFGHGFVSAAMGNRGGVLGQAVVGGAISKMSGGKFESGAATAAFSYVVRMVVGALASSGGAVEEEVVEEEEIVITSAGNSKPKGNLTQAQQRKLAIQPKPDLLVPYSNYEDAAKALRQKIITASANNSREWGGAIFEDVSAQNSTFYISDAQTSGLKRDIIWGTNWVKSRSSGSVRAVSAMHLHPSGESNLFSTADQSAARKIRRYSGHKKFRGFYLLHEDKNFTPWRVRGTSRPEKYPKKGSYCGVNFSSC